MRELDSSPTPSCFALPLASLTVSFTFFALKNREAVRCLVVFRVDSLTFLERGEKLNLFTQVLSGGCQHLRKDHPSFASRYFQYNDPAETRRHASVFYLFAFFFFLSSLVSPCIASRARGSLISYPSLCA